MEEIVHVPGLGQTHDPGSEEAKAERERRRGERKYEVMLRRQHVAEKLVAHWPYRAIAKELGVSLGTIAKDAAKIRETWRDRMAQTYDQHIAEEFGKLDQVEMALMPKVLHGGRDGGANISAVQMWVAVQDRRARLMGLDKPIKVEHTQPEDVEAKKARAKELFDQVDELEARRRAG